MKRLVKCLVSWSLGCDRSDCFLNTRFEEWEYYIGESLAKVFNFMHSGLQNGLFETSKAVASSKRVNVKQSTFQMVFCPNPDTLPDVKLP